MMNKFCVDCKHFYAKSVFNNNYYEDKSFCKASIGLHELVSGRVFSDENYYGKPYNSKVACVGAGVECYFMRYGGPCGLEGKLWEPK